jgi:hypothetical protein
LEGNVPYLIRGKCQHFAGGFEENHENCKLVIGNDRERMLTRETLNKKYRAIKCIVIFDTDYEVEYFVMSKALLNTEILSTMCEILIVNA